MLTREQMRMARAALGWSIRDLSRQTGVSINSISRYENSSADAYAQTLRLIQKTFEDHGLEFLEESAAHGEGVRFRQPRG